MSVPAYRNLGRSGLQVSPLCLGAMNFGNDTFGCDEETSLAVINAYLDAGHNFIDTANTYAGTRSETIVGKAVKGRRDGLVIATKGGSPAGPGPFDVGTSRKALMRAVEGSLERLDTDYIDLYQMHRFDYETPLVETLSTLNDLVRQGKVRHIGISNWSASQITEAACLTNTRNWEPIISLQPQYNILVRDIEVEIVPVCQRFGLGIIPWSPLGGGMLSGKYKRGDEPPADSRFAAPGIHRDIFRPFRERNYDIAEIVAEEATRLGTTAAALSLAWNLNQPGVVSPIIGPKSVKQLEENLGALALEVPEETVRRINEGSEPAIGYPHSLARALPMRRPA